MPSPNGERPECALAPSVTRFGRCGGEVAEDEEVGDAELLRRIRTGDLDAMGVLYQRHREAALRVATAVSGDPDLAQDLVSSAFERIHAALMRGHGPQESFRAYLYTVIRRLAIEAGQARAREDDVGDWEPYDAATALADQTDGSVEARLVATAFGALPERHQAVLWYLDVEDLTPAQAAPLFNLTPNAVSALAIRARDALRDAYVQAHVSDSPVHADCGPVRRLLGARARDRLAARDRVKVEAHLAVCDECPAVLAELRDVSGGLRSAFGPIAIGAAAAGGVAAASLAGGAQSAQAATVPPSGGRSVSDVVEKAVIAAVAVLAVVGIGSAIVNVTQLPATDPGAMPTAPTPSVAAPSPSPTSTTPTPRATLSSSPTPTPEPTPPVVPPVRPQPAPPPTPEPVPTQSLPPEASLFLDVVDEGDAGLGDGTRTSRIIVEVKNTARVPIDAALKLRLPGGMQVDGGRAIDGDPEWACPAAPTNPLACTATRIPAGDTVSIEVPVLTPAADIDSRPVANLRIANS